MPGPRVIEIRHPRDPVLRLMRADVGSAWSIARIPALLHTCRQSRDEALKSYELSFGLEDGSGRIYVNFSHDTVYFGARSDFYGAQAIVREDGSVGHVRGLENIQSLAIKSKYQADVSKFDLGLLGA